MSSRNQPCRGRPRFFFMGPLPPTDGGINYLCGSLLEADLGESLRLEVLNTRKGYCP